MDYERKGKESISRKISQEAQDPELLLETTHSWLSQMTNQDEDTVDEVIRYTLDELRLA